MSELANRAISEGTQSQEFTDFRKLTACSIALTEGSSGAEAAAIADKTAFQKAVQYAVAQGELLADEAVESLIDRGASQLSTFLNVVVPQAVTAGCCAAGTWVGHFFGPIGMKTGAAIGLKIAGLLNSNVSTLIDKGVAMLKDVAKNIYHEGKRIVKNYVKNLLQH